MKGKNPLLLVVLILLSAALACSRLPALGESAAAQTPTSADATLTPQPTPTHTPQPTFTSAPTESSTAGPCANVFYPFVQDRQWIYQKMTDDPQFATPDPLTSKFGITVKEVTESQAILDAVDLGSGVTTETTAECRDGAIASFPMMTLGSLFGDLLGGDIDIAYVSGVFAPSEAELAAANWNMQWEGEYVASGTLTLSAEGETTTATLSDSPLHLTWQTAGQETVTVPAGTYENAYKVNRTAEMEATLTSEGLTGQAVLTIQTVHWFAPYVGLLKTEVVSGTLTVFGVSFPVEVIGWVELIDVQ